MALHPYAQNVSDVAREIKGVRRAMQKHHDANRRLLITEIGWGSGAPKEQHDFVLTPKGQKQRLLQSFKLLLAHRSQWHLAGVYWFDWRDPAPGKGLCGFCYSSGLLKHNGKAKPRSRRSSTSSAHDGAEPRTALTVRSRSRGRRRPRAARGARRRRVRRVRLDVHHPAATVPPAPRDFYGVAANINDVLTPADYANMQAAGVRTLRLIFFWPSIQSTQGAAYNWSSLDAKVEAAAEHGIRVLPVFIGTPSFLTGCAERNCQVRLPNKTPAGSAAWQVFLAAAAARYGPQGEFWKEHPDLKPQPVGLWEIWNEENNFNANGDPRATPAEFTDLLRISREALQSVDPRREDDGRRDVRHAPWVNRPTSYRMGLHAGPLRGRRRALHRRHRTSSLCDQGLRHRLPDEQGPRRHGLQRRLGDAAVRHRDRLGLGRGARRPRVRHDACPGRRRTSRKPSTSSWRTASGGTSRASTGSTGATRRPGKGLCAFCYSSGLYFNDGTPKPSLAAYKAFALAGR